MRQSSSADAKAPHRVISVVEEAMFGLPRLDLDRARQVVVAATPARSMVLGSEEGFFSLKSSGQIWLSTFTIYF